MSLIVFSHANSFPAATYGVLFKSLRARGYTVKAVDRFGHDPKYPVTNNWPHLVQQLHDLARREADKAGEPAWLVGHSLGGFLSLMCAARHPELARGVLLIDSPILGGWRATTLGVIKRTQLVGSVSPGAVSRRRKTNWPDAAAALEHFRHKKAFARWEPQVLADYVQHCTHDAGGQRVLSFDPARQPRPPAQAPPAEMSGGLRGWHAVGRNEAGRHDHDREGGARPHHDARRQPPVSNGKAAGHRRRDRGQPARHGVVNPGTTQAGRPTRCETHPLQGAS